MVVIIGILVLPAGAQNPSIRSALSPQTFTGTQSPVHRIASGRETSPPASWIDELRNGLGRYIWTHPDLPLEPYLETLTLVRESVGAGDRRAVKREMETYLRMLAVHAQGISDAGAKELSALAVRLTPAEVYGISIPASLQRRSEQSR
jgi:hypothetical protein